MGKCCPIDNYFIFHWSFVTLAGNEDIHKISDKFDFGPNRSIHFWSYCHWATEKDFPIDLQWRKCCPDNSYFTFDRIFINLAGNQDSYKILDEFEFRQDRIIHFGVTCPWVAKRAHIWHCPIDGAFSFDGSSSNLQVARTLPDDLEFWPYQTIDFCAACNIFSNVFKFGWYQTIDFRVTCPWEPKKPIVDLVRSIETSFLIGCSSNLQFMKTAVKSRIS